MTFLFIKILHVLSMAFWLSSIVKEITVPVVFNEDMRENKRLNAQREKLIGAISTTSGMSTIISGCTLLYILGIENVSWTIHLGLTLTIIMACIGAFGVGGTFNSIEDAINNNATLSEINNISKKLRRYSITLLILWLTVFLLMSLRHMA